MGKLSLTTALATCAALAALSASAHARTNQIAIFQDDAQLLTLGLDVRDQRLDEIAALGAEVVKLYIPWSRVAPGGATRPPGFDGASPASYAEAAWEPYDGLVRAATARGLRVLVAPTTPAPGWATQRREGDSGVYKPSAKEFGRFFQAAGIRYGGAYPAGSPDPLPRVSFWSIGNEPNHPNWLQPLGSARGRRAVAPHLYRELVREAVTGLRASGHARDRVLFGELLPVGHRHYGARKNVRPVEFLREMFCLDRRLRPYRARAAGRRGCRRFRRIAGVSGLAFHPYTRAGGPRVREPNRDDATIRSISRLTKVLDAATARRRLAGRRLPVYNTEFGYQSDPPDIFMTPIRRVPAYLNEAEWMSWGNPRVASWSQYLMVDDIIEQDAGGLARYRRFQTGLRFEDGRPKPGVYNAYRLPIFVRLRGSRTVEVWGAARSVPGNVVQVEQRIGRGGYRDVSGGAVRTSSRGYFRKHFRFSSASRRTFRFRVEDGDETLYSRSMRPARR